LRSAALPKVACRNPPNAGPARCASVAVPSPMIAASGTNDTAASTNTQAEPGVVHASSHEAGAATSSRFSWLELSARRRPISAHLDKMQPRRHDVTSILQIGLRVCRSEEHTSELQSPYDLV